MKSNTLIHRLIAASLKATSRDFRNAAVAIALLVASAQLSSAAVTVTATNDDGVTPNSTKKNPGDNVTYTELREFVAARLARFKTPSRIFFREVPLPRTATGKVLKRDLRNELAESR